MPASHRAYLLSLVHETRTSILERFIGASVTELRGLLLLTPPPSTTTEPSADVAEGEGAAAAADTAGATAEGTSAPTGNA